MSARKGHCRACGGPLVQTEERTYHPAATSDPQQPCPALLPIPGTDHRSFDVPADQFDVDEDVPEDRPALPRWWGTTQMTEYLHVLGPVGDGTAPIVRCRQHPEHPEERHLLVDGEVRQLCQFAHDGSDANIEHPPILATQVDYPPHPEPTLDDLPVDTLLRAHHEMDRWAREHDFLRPSQRLVVEVRAVPRVSERIGKDGGEPRMDGTDLFGERPKSAIVVHANKDGWT